jgi:hypothetical protein
VPREVKVDPGKFPDLRFEAPTVDGAVQVEVKVATFGHWDFAKLSERLRNQLVGQYLRAANARYGVYALFRADATRQWHDLSGAVLDWNGLLLRLQEEANGIVASRPDIDDVVVLGIDVTPHLLQSSRRI